MSCIIYFKIFHHRDPHLEMPSYLSRNIDFEELLTHFNNVQQKHRIYKHQKIKQQLQSNVDPVTHS